MRTAAGVPSYPVPARYPTFHTSGLDYWYGVISCDACVRLCLHPWAVDECKEAAAFLANECALLWDAFRLRNTLLQLEDELMRKQSSELFVCKVRMWFEPSHPLHVRIFKVNLNRKVGCNSSQVIQCQVNRLCPEKVIKGILCNNPRRPCE